MSNIEPYDECEYLVEDDTSGHLEKLDYYLNPVNTLVDVLPNILTTFKDMQLADKQYKYNFDCLCKSLDHNLDKFKALVSGAEHRLERNMNVLDALTMKLLNYNLGTLDVNEMRAQQTILDLIQQTNDRFDNELDKLYNL